MYSSKVFNNNNNKVICKVRTSDIKLEIGTLYRKQISHARDRSRQQKLLQAIQTTEKPVLHKQKLTVLRKVEGTEILLTVEVFCVETHKWKQHNMI